MKLALAWLAGLALLSLGAPFWLGETSQAMDFARVLEPPSPAHWMGTDSLGRDVFARLACGAGVSLGVGLVAAGLSALIGTLVGAAAGYYGGRTDKALMALVDAFLCFPVFFLILAVVAILGPSLLNVMIIIGMTGWMGTARLVRAEVMSLKHREFILAARAMGAGDGRVIFGHLLPNAVGPVIVSAVLGLSAAILTEAGLSFLGIGVQPPFASWGTALMDGKATLGAAWWLTLFPGLAIFFTVLAVNAVGEHFSDRMKGERV